jgi:hypothetical protein
MTPEEPRGLPIGRGKKRSIDVLHFDQSDDFTVISVEPKVMASRADIPTVPAGFATKPKERESFPLDTAATPSGTFAVAPAPQHRNAKIASLFLGTFALPKADFPRVCGLIGRPASSSQFTFKA